MSNYHAAPQSGDVYAPDTHECQTCGKSTQKAGQAHVRAIMQTRNGDLREYAAGDVMTWDATGAIELKNSSMDFVRWEVLCAPCKYEPNRVTAQQRQDVIDNMQENEITPKATQKAYKIIQQLLAPGLMGGCKANDQQKQYAAKVVLWHWPQASNEPMPADIEKLCKGLVVA